LSAKYCDCTISSVSLELYDNYCEYEVNLMIIGYTKGDFKSDNSNEHVVELKAFGCAKIFKEKRLVKNLDEQTVFRKLRSEMCPGDVLVVHDMMCLGRNKLEIKKEWEAFIDEKIDIVILRKPVLDTRKFKETDSDEQYISKTVLSLLSWMVDEEQNRIRYAQREGIENAKKQGKFRGRKRKYHPDATGKDKAVYEMIINELSIGTSVMDIHRKTSVARSTIYNIKNDYINR